MLTLSRKSAPQMDDLAMASVVRRAMQMDIPLSAAPSESTVQRTRRVVQQQAIGSARRRRRLVSILMACLLCSVFLAIVTVPLWNALDEFAHANNIPDLQIHMLFLGVWFLPATAVSLLLWRGYSKSIAKSR